MKAIWQFNRSFITAFLFDCNASKHVCVSFVIDGGDDVIFDESTVTITEDGLVGLDLEGGNPFFTIKNQEKGGCG